MHVRALLSWGIVIYAVLNLVWTALVVNGLSGNIVGRAVMIVTLIGLTAIAARSLRLMSERDALVYAIGWVLIAACLDALTTVSVAGWGIFAQSNLWVGYALLFFTPLIVTALSKRALS